MEDQEAGGCHPETDVKIYRQVGGGKQRELWHAARNNPVHDGLLFGNEPF